jgi:hypothetical protein
MRTARLARGMLFCIALLLTTAALARRRPKNFVEPRELTEEQLEAAKERSKYKYNPWQKDAPQQAAPFPWMEVSLGVIAFAIALPFGIRYFRDTAEEVAPGSAYGPRTRDAEDLE